MNRDEYIAHPAVSGFAGYLREYLVAKPFIHRWKKKGSDQTWECTSIENAVIKYMWKGKDYDQTSRLLGDFGAKLRMAVPNDPDLAIGIAVQIQDWGGTGRGKKNSEGEYRTGNIAAIRRYGDQFAEYLERCMKSFETDEAGDVDLNGLALTSNAGFTKIYSVLLDDFCIYDSRVAAALQLFVRKYCEENHLDGVPEVIGVRGLPEHDPGNRRNASDGRFIFKFGSGHVAHYRWNMRINWLLKAAVDGTPFLKKHPNDALRALEAALFMIGYSVTGQPEFS